MSRRPCFAALLLVACLAAPESAGAASVLDARVSAAGATSAPCQQALRRGAPGVVTRAVLVPGAGQVEVRMNGDRGDWDVALFDASGRAVAAAASPDAQEVAGGWVLDRSTLTLQACRRAGNATSVPVTVTHTPLTGDAKAARANPPQLVSVNTPTRAAKNQLVALGLDMTEHGGSTSLGVVLHDEQDRAALKKAGFTYRVLVKDLVAKDARDRAAEARGVAAAEDLPSGRTGTYRTLADYETELKKLAAENPGLVRLFTLPNKTWGGRDVLGVEITENVTANDGKPAFLNMGVHHAREWPSGEHAIEWAYELIKEYKAGNPRTVDIVRRARNIVVPIVNADGFDASRSAGAVGGADGGRDESVDDTAYLLAGATTGGEYRRKNCRSPTDPPTGTCASSAGLAEPGVDPNRNYGQFWGGPGSDTNPATQTYRGPGPFSEPESRNIQWLVSHNQVTTLITNHTTAGLVLRAPGLAAVGDPVDEGNGYKALGDEMAKHNGYFSQKGFELYDTTGTTEDWSYNATGGYGFTFEIYCGDPNYATGDCDDPAFHPFYATMIKEWDGTSAQADHTDPDAPDHLFNGLGNREAYYLAAESTVNAARHSILQGTAPAGTRLRLTKAFKTETFDGTQQVDDSLETVYDVGALGEVSWHVNPSTRPIVAKTVGDPNGGEPAPPRTSTGSTAGSSETEDDQPTDDGAAVVDPTNGTPTSVSYNDHPFAIPATGDNQSMGVRIEWATPVSDWDVKLYEDVNDNFISDAGDKEVGTSAQGVTNFEEVFATGLTPGNRYVLRVVNYAAGEPYTMTVTYNGPPPFRPGQTETYTLTCESAAGAALKTQQVFVARGEVARVDPCPAVPATPPTTTPTTTPKPGGGGTSTPACAATAGFASVGFARSGSGARFDLAPRSAGAKATVSVFQQSSGRQITGERLIARFTGKSKAFSWNGKPTQKGRKVTDGYYFVRYTLGKDTRRVTLRRAGGKFTRVGDFYRRASCDLLPSYKLTRPVFGGTADRSLGITYRVARRATVTVTVLRGSKKIKTFAARTAPANKTIRLSLPAKGLARGDYTVRLVAKAGSETVTSTLTSRRL